MRSTLCFLPCMDSPEMAQQRRRELDISHEEAAALGVEAYEAATRGFYVAASGVSIPWSVLVQHAWQSKRSIPPDAELSVVARDTFAATKVQVSNETTLGAARRLADSGLKPIALNFANGTVPGGGFLRGARAQEEALCRRSALFETLVDDPMYEAHRERDLQDASDWVIYSPDVPVFRADDGSCLEEPWLLSFLTCAAPYEPEVGQPESGDLLQWRIQRVLEVASSLGYEALVLGAWGCGAFHNDPHRTARDFRFALENDYCGVFSEVVFAIADWSPERRYLGPFRDVFAEGDSTTIHD